MMGREVHMSIAAVKNEVGSHVSGQEGPAVGISRFICHGQPFFACHFFACQPRLVVIGQNCAQAYLVNVEVVIPLHPQLNYVHTNPGIMCALLRTPSICYTFTTDVVWSHI